LHLGLPSTVVISSRAKLSDAPFCFFARRGIYGAESMPGTRQGNAGRASSLNLPSRARLLLLLLLLLRHVSVVSLFRFKFHFISHFSEISLTGVPKPEMTHPWARAHLSVQNLVAWTNVLPIVQGAFVVALTSISSSRAAARRCLKVRTERVPFLVATTASTSGAVRVFLLARTVNCTSCGLGSPAAAC
jgi:hypothetical protein